MAVVDADDWRSAIAASVLMADPLGAPLLISTADEVPEPTSQALEALAPEGGKASGGAQVFAIGDAAVPGDLEARRVAGGPGGRGRDRRAARAALRQPPAPLRRRPLRGSRLRHAGRGLGGALRRSGPLRGPRAAAEGDRGRAAPPPERPGLRPRPLLGDLLRHRARDRRHRQTGAARLRRGSRSLNAIELARYADGDFGWNVNDPGHGFVVARSDEPLDAVAAAPLSASGTWGPLLLTDSADTLPAALRGYLLDVKPGYTTDPTRAFYNHVWVIGDQEAIDVTQQAEIDELAELAKIGGGS